jgi:hypothetical protein
LQRALRAMPTEERARFWQHKVERDEALGPLRRLPDYRQLAGTFARPEGGAAPR